MSNATSSNNSYHCLSLWPLDMPTFHLLIWAAITGLLSLITTVANVLLIYSLYKTRQLNSITNKFILLMNICDLCFGVVVLPILVILILTKSRFQSCVFETVTEYFALFLAYFSFFMLLCVSVDRYIHVTKLNKYNAFMNEFRMKIVAALSFVMSAVIAYIAVYTPSFALQVSLNCADIICVLSMFFLYTLVFRKISLHANNFKKMLGDVGISKANREVKRELSATKTIRVLLGALLVLYFPYNIASAVFAYNKFIMRTKMSLKLNMLTYLAYTMVFSNAAANAIIFSFGNTTIKRFICNKLPISKLQVAPSEVEETRKKQATQNQAPETKIQISMNK